MGPTRRSPGAGSSSMTWGLGRQAGEESETARCWEGEHKKLLLQGRRSSSSRNMLLGWTELTGCLLDRGLEASVTWIAPDRRGGQEVCTAVQRLAASGDFVTMNHLGMSTCREVMCTLFSLAKDPVAPPPLGRKQLRSSGDRTEHHQLQCDAISLNSPHAPA